MAEPPGSQHALGIEAVEWLPTSESSVTVIVTGRWRRRASWRGRPVLVIEAHGHRHRFPAIPDPPSVAGASPGTWRMSFSIPAWLAPQLGGRAWLQLGVVVVPLPPVVERATAGRLAEESPSDAQPQASGAGAPAERDTSAEAEAAPPAPTAEFTGAREPSERAGEPARSGWPPPSAGHPPPSSAEREAPLESELPTPQPTAPGAEAAPVPGEPTGPGVEPTAPTEAEAGAHTGDALAAAAELANRIKQLDAERRMASAQAEAEQQRRTEIERQLDGTRRRMEEAERLAQEAQLERQHLLRAPTTGASWRERLPAELELARRAPPAREATRRDGFDGELARRARDQLRREQEAGRVAELGHWRKRTAELERQLCDSELRAERFYEVIEDLRSVLDIIRGVPPGHGEAAAGGTSAEHEPAISDQASALQPERLDAALSRLRETIAPVEADETTGDEVEHPELDAEQAPATDEEPATAAEQTADGEAKVGEESGAAEPGAAGPATKDRGAELPSPAPERRAAGPLPSPAPERRAAGPLPPPAPERRAAGPLPPPARATRKSWLLRTLRALVKDDAAAAGRVMLGLLPAQRLSSSEPLAYDLLLADAGSFQFTARDAKVRLAKARGPRGGGQVDFQLTGELATFARLLVAGPIRRRSGVGVADVTGDRKALAALLDLIRTPYGLGDLYAAGARLDPSLTFTLIARMIDPRSTAGHRFTIAHRGPEASAYLRVLDGSRPSVSGDPPLGPVAATVVCKPEELLAVLAARDHGQATIRGHAEVLELLCGWVAHAQGS